jgi:hypothetical protein
MQKDLLKAEFRMLKAMAELYDTAEAAGEFYVRDLAQRFTKEWFLERLDEFQWASDCELDDFLAKTSP